MLEENLQKWGREALLKDKLGCEARFREWNHLSFPKGEIQFSKT